MRIRIKEFPKLLNLGCGSLNPEGYVGLDIADFGQPIVWDARLGIPLPNDSLDKIYSSNFLEHLEDKDILPLFDEMHRVCKDNGVINIVVPAKDTDQGYYADHKSFWDESRFRGLVEGFRGKFITQSLKRKGWDVICYLIVVK